MARIDIRDKLQLVVEEIQFADRDGTDYLRLLNYDGKKILIRDTTEWSEVHLHSKQEVQDLIKALNKAIELKWIN